MAPHGFTNSNFINMHNSCTKLLRVLESAARSNDIPGVEGDEDEEAATEKMVNDLRKFSLSEFREPKPSGYGPLPQQAIGPLRRFYAACKSAYASEEINEAMRRELHSLLCDLIKTVTPDHPFLSVPFEGHEEGNVDFADPWVGAKDDESDEHEESDGEGKQQTYGVKKTKGKAPAPFGSARKTKRKRTVKQKGKQRVGTVQTPAGLPVRRSDRIAERNAAKSANANSNNAALKELVGVQGDEGDDNGSDWLDGEAEE